VTAFGFNENDAKRIGRAVRAVERDQNKVRLGGPNAEGAAPGVRLLIAQHEGYWPLRATATVTVYNGLPGEVLSAVTMVAYNHFVPIGTHTATPCTSRWLTLGHNGFAWHPLSAESNCGTCLAETGGIDFSAIPGYQNTAVQLLGHDGGGCIKWFNTTTCAAT